MRRRRNQYARVEVRSRRRAARAGVLLAAAAWASTGCGDSKSPAPGTARTGTEVFTDAGCGSSHTLATAGARGQGPNLDRLRPTASAVERAVREGGDGMPSYSSMLSGDDIRIVARFVARNAGR